MIDSLTANLNRLLNTNPFKTGHDGKTFRKPQTPLLELVEAAKLNKPGGFERALERYPNLNLSAGTVAGEELRALLGKALAKRSDILASTTHAIEHHQRNLAELKLKAGGSVPPGGSLSLHGGPLLKLKDIKKATYEHSAVKPGELFNQKTMDHFRDDLATALRNGDKEAVAAIRSLMCGFSTRDFKDVNFVMPDGTKLSGAELIARHPDPAIRALQHGLKDPRIQEGLRVGYRQHVLEYQRSPQAARKAPPMPLGWGGRIKA